MPVLQSVSMPILETSHSFISDEYRLECDVDKIDLARGEKGGYRSGNQYGPLASFCADIAREGIDCSTKRSPPFPKLRYALGSETCNKNWVRKNPHDHGSAGKRRSIS